MMKAKFDKTFWETRYQNKETGWDIGAPSSPITNYIDQLTDKTIKILIPGAGHAHEAEYLYQKGFSNVFVLDIAEVPLKAFKQRLPDFPDSHLIQGDFFEHDTKYDLIIEQTFFCALDPVLRHQYVTKMHDLLKPNGKLVGLLFNFQLTEVGPPFGGSLAEYQKLFMPYFKINTLESAYNSIKPRAERELFIIFETIT